MSSDVAGVQAAATATPCAPARDAVLVPVIVIVPELLVTTPAALPAIFTPKLATLPEAAPVREIGPLPVAVEILEAPPVRLIP